MIWFVGHLLAICIGVSLGLIGGGGSILAAPVLIYVMQVAPKSAFAMTLVIVGVASVIGIVPHWRQGNVNLKVAALFAPPAMVGAYIGARIASLPVVTPTLQLMTFAVMMLIAAFSMIRKGKGNMRATGLQEREDLSVYSPPSSHLTVSGMSGAIAQDHPHKYRSLTIAAEGFGVGMLTGFVGIGGGFLVIPALVLLGGLPMKEAIGTSLIILSLKSVTGFAGYFGHVPLDWVLMATFTIAASAGILVGAFLTRFIHAKQLEKGFGYFVLAVALFILVKH